MSTTKKRKKWKEKAFALALLVLVIVSVGQAYVYYSKSFWALDQARQYLYLASTSPDMPKMIEYMARAGGYLQPYSGNPSFTLSPYNDFNTLRERLFSTIATMQIWMSSAKPVQDFAYQTAVANIHGTITDISNEITDTKVAMLYNPAWNPLGYLLLVIYIMYALLIIKYFMMS